MKALLADAKKKRMLLTGAIVLGSILLAILIDALEGYEGLGEVGQVPENTYDMSLLYEQDGRLQYEDERYETETGIDVSSYQKEIDWEAVKKDGIDFAMVRLGYRGYQDGELKLDSQYEANVRGAKDAGIETGVYFFSQATTPEEAMEEARFVLRKIRGKKIDGPIGFDMEFIEGANRINDLTVEEKTEIADAFCQTIAKKGYQPVIYGNQPWLLKHLDLSYLTEYPVWLAHFASTTDYPYAFSVWQYSDSGQVAGIEGNVDMNLRFIPR